MSHDLDKMPGDRYERQRLRIGHIVGKLKEFVCYKDKHYKSSWRKRGGSQAFAVISRKWDRFEAIAEDNGYDIFHVFAIDSRKEGIADDCFDLIGYMLVLVEHMVELGHIQPEQLEKILNPLYEVKAEKGTNTTGMEHPFGHDPDLDNLPEEKVKSRTISGFPIDEEY